MCRCEREPWKLRVLVLVYATVPGDRRREMPEHAPFLIFEGKRFAGSY